ncbi:RNA polymerase sigma factor [Kitasatospora arboriphila]
MRYWEDQSIEECATILNRSSGTIRSDTHRGLAQLRTILGDSLHEIAGT